MWLNEEYKTNFVAFQRIKNINITSISRENKENDNDPEDHRRVLNKVLTRLDRYNMYNPHGSGIGRYDRTHLSALHTM